VHSLASEHLQELESLVGSERQKQEEVVGVTMGTMYHGEALYLCIRYYVRLTGSLLAGSDTVGVS
jgi:hypothetical protein